MRPATFFVADRWTGKCACGVHLARTVRVVARDGDLEATVTLLDA